MRKLSRREYEFLHLIPRMGAQVATSATNPSSFAARAKAFSAALVPLYPEFFNLEDVIAVMKTEEKAFELINKFKPKKAATSA